MIKVIICVECMRAYHIPPGPEDWPACPSCGGDEYKLGLRNRAHDFPVKKVEDDQRSTRTDQ
jgi:PHP family Zn ribbon phosphoesterase